MNLFVIQYAKQEDVDAELDDRSDIDLEVMASPQFAQVCTEANLEAALAKVKQDVEDEMDELREGAEELSEYEWIDSDWVAPIVGRRSRSLFLHDKGDEDPIAMVVVQEVEAFTD